MNTNESKPINPTQEAKPTRCVYSGLRWDEDNLGDVLDLIMSGQLAVERNDMISLELLDGTPVDLVVTDLGADFVRFESRDCLGAYTSARGLLKYLDGICTRLPDELRERIAEVERVYLDANGEKKTYRCKVFAPAASEIFPPDECYGDKGLYTQLEWYKDVHNRVRAFQKGSYAHWYWTSSRSAYSSSYYCGVSYIGSASNANASNAIGVAPFGCILPITR